MAALAITTYVLEVGLWSWSDEVCKKADARCALGTHVIGTGLVAALAYYLVFLRREARAAMRWRRTARRSPEDLISWISPSAGLTALAAKAPVVESARAIPRPLSAAPGWRVRRRWPSLLDSVVPRKGLVREIAAELNEGAGPQIIVGDTGSGKTMLLLELSRYLARHGQVPVPMTLRGAKTINFADQARAAYIRLAKAKDDEEAKKQWAWARQRQLITILADDLEQSAASVPARLEALGQASQLELRLIVTTRPYGLPHSRSRRSHIGSRVDLPELSPADLRHDLMKRARATGAGVSLDDQIKDIVEKVRMAATPYYLSLARVLVGVQAIDEVRTDGDVRLGLVHTYRKAFETGRVTPDDGLTIDTRKAVFERLEAIAYFRLLGENCMKVLSEKLETVPLRQTEIEMFDSPFDLAKRMEVLEDRHDDQIRFAQPTTMAYFASEFLRNQSLAKDHWEPVLNQDATRMSPLLMLCLGFATSVTDRDTHESQAAPTVRSLCQTITSANGSSDHSSAHLKLCTVAADIARFQIEAPATARHRLSEEAQKELISLVIKTAHGLSTLGGRLTVEKQSLVDAIASLGAHEALWESATAANQDYAVRREATRKLVAHTDSAINLIGPRISDVIDAGWRHVGQYGQSDDDTGELFDKFRAVAWILPSLYTKAGELGRKLEHSPQDLLKLARKLTIQLGLESSVAQGIKLDAMTNPDAPVDEFALRMLEGSEHTFRAKFWFTRILLLQAVTRRCFPSKPTRVAARPKVAAIVKAAASDDLEHKFVRETARLCSLALRKGNWEKYIWSDMTEIAAGTPHRLSVEATHLIGDVIIMLNLNGRQQPQGRHRFGQTLDLPRCLSLSHDRHELLGLRGPHGCPLTDPKPEAPLVISTPETSATQQCLCPYLYEPPARELSTRRELSRAFCRHQRITARPLRWAPNIHTDALREFWSGMERRARF